MKKNTFPNINKHAYFDLKENKLRDNKIQSTIDWLFFSEKKTDSHAEKDVCSKNTIEICLINYEHNI